jgi:predicted transposase YdaD
MYDDTCRFLAETFSADFAGWLLGESIPFTELKPSELSLDPIRADALILLKASLAAASAILAGIRLEQDVIYRLLRRDVMQESVIYRSIQQEAQKQEKRSIALNFLRDGLSIEAVARGTGLSIEEVQRSIVASVWTG